jgi:hypothetical protein
LPHAGLAAQPTASAKTWCEQLRCSRERSLWRNNANKMNGFEMCEWIEIIKIGSWKKGDHFWMINELTWLRTLFKGQTSFIWKRVPTVKWRTKAERWR